jgi:release factor H-coupled RctB family protein
MIKLISTEQSWIEGNAIQQLDKVAELEGVKSVVGLPDLHSGPVGMAMASAGILYPHLAGNDVGCGLGLWQTDVLARKAKRDKWAKKLSGLDSPYEGNLQAFLAEQEIDFTRDIPAFGTVGGGNHFAELQQISKVYNKELAEEAGIDKQKLYVLVHSGSRTLGKHIMDSHIAKNGSIGLHEESEAGQEYIREHDYAVKWGRANRALIALRFLTCLGMKGSLISDITHNSIIKEKFDDKSLWVHRKGASPNNKGICVIAGSRGAHSYIVKPSGDLVSSNFSIAHGAGRKHRRSEMKARLKNKYKAAALTQTSFGSKVICNDRELLYEEAPEAYKNIDQVIKDLESFGLIEVIATLQPVITYKVG